MTKVKLATWNVNSIRARLPVVLKFLEENKPDIVLIQELKARDEDFPKSEIENLNYNIVFKGQKSYNGVAIFSKFPISDVIYSLPTFKEDIQARYIEGWINIENKGLRVASIYAPNGNPINSEKYDYKLKWLESFVSHSKSLLSFEEVTILGGDFNICPTNLDAAEPSLLLKDAIYQEEPKQIYRMLVNEGYFDSYRCLNKNKPGYTYWDYGRAFTNDIGVRIDFFLMSSYALDLCEKVFVDKEPRFSQRPSDHTPLCTTINL